MVEQWQCGRVEGELQGGAGGGGGGDGDGDGLEVWVGPQ